MFLDSGKCFGFWEVFCSVGSVLDPWKCLYPERCFGFLEGLLDYGKWFGFWEVFCSVGSVLDSGN